MNKNIYPAPRRINNELNRLDDTYCFEFEKIDDDEYEITFFINTDIYTFKLLKTYPFAPPIIKINGRDYYELIHKCIKLTNKYIADNGKDTCLKNKNCLCCTSYGCKTNWSPAICLKDIIQEIIIFKKHFYDLYKVKYVSKILENKYIHEKGIKNIIIKFLIDI